MRVGGWAHGKQMHANAYSSASQESDADEGGKAGEEN